MLGVYDIFDLSLIFYFKLLKEVGTRETYDLQGIYDTKFKEDYITISSYQCKTISNIHIF